MLPAIFPCRGRYNLFEAWFLLVQCAHWVEVAVRLLATSSPENCQPLLWLLVFFYHPTTRGRHRAALMVSSAQRLSVTVQRRQLAFKVPCGGNASPCNSPSSHQVVIVSLKLIYVEQQVLLLKCWSARLM